MSKQSDRRRRVVRATAPAAGLLAAGLLVWQGSYAAFSATTTDVNNAWSTGNMVLANNGGTATYAASTTATLAFSVALGSPAAHSSAEGRPAIASAPKPLAAKKFRRVRRFSLSIFFPLRVSLKECSDRCRGRHRHPAA